MTAIAIRWLGHSTFEITLDGKTILTDPFLTALQMHNNGKGQA